MDNDILGGLGWDPERGRLLFKDVRYLLIPMDRRGAAKLEYLLVVAGVAMAALAAATYFGWRLVDRFRSVAGPAPAGGPPANASPGIDLVGGADPSTGGSRPKAGPDHAEDGRFDPNWLVGEDDPIRDSALEGEEDKDVKRERATCVQWANLDEIVRQLLGGEDEETRNALDDAAARIRQENPDWTEDKKIERIRKEQESLRRTLGEGRLRQARAEMDRARKEMAPHRRGLREAERRRREADTFAQEGKKARENEKSALEGAADKREEAKKERERAAPEEQKKQKGEKHNALFVKARNEAAIAADKAAARLAETAAQAAATAEQAEQKARQATEEAARMKEVAEVAMRPAAQRHRDARARILREHAGVLRESQIARLNTFSSNAFNPGEYRTGDDKLTLATYVLGDDANPWTNWGKDQQEFRERIVTHELSHALMDANPEAVRKFLEVRWNDHAKELKEARKAVMAEYDLRKGELEDDPLWKDRPERERKIEALRRANDALETRERDFRTRHPGSPDFPARFPGDLHAFSDEEGKEYYAVAMELYFYDPDRFESCYSAEERQVLEAMLEGGETNDLHPTQASRRKEKH